jgi:hypothetical protein
MEATGGDVANSARLERDDIVHRKNAALLSDDEVDGLRTAFARWDWTTAGGIPAAFAEEERGGGPNPLFASQTLVTTATSATARR